MASHTQKHRKTPHTNASPRFRRGDYLKIAIVTETVISLWICVDHCDEERAIVFGHIDSDVHPQMGKALRRGARLAASYSRVLEHQGAQRLAI